MTGKTNSLKESAYDRARLAILKHAATQTLVESGEYILEHWAEEFAEHRAKFKRVVSILHPDKDHPEIDPRTRTTLVQCDEFIRLNASSTWEGRWVDPLWRKAALDRERNERELRATQVLEAAEVKFDYTEDDNSRKTFARMESKPRARTPRYVLDAVEIEVQRPSGSTLKNLMTPEPSTSPQKRQQETTRGALQLVKHTRSQISLKQQGVSRLGIPDTSPLTVRNAPKCDRCIDKKKECFSEAHRNRCEACRKGRLACSLVQKNRKSKVALSANNDDGREESGSEEGMDSKPVTV